MTPFEAALLGLVEGLTEFLPVSSTGHLLVTERLLGIEGVAADAFAISIQAGAVVAVIILYFARIRSAIAGLAGRDPNGKRLLLNLILAFIPAGVVGFLFEGTLKKLFFNMTSIALALVVWGAVILVVEYRRKVAPQSGKTVEEMDWKGSLLIGVMQCFALWPGTSRSLVTILGGLLAGLSLSASVEFSFLLGILVLSAAAAKDLLTEGASMLNAFGWLSMTVGFVTASISAAVAIRWMVAWLNRHGLALFGWYRVALGVALLGLFGCSDDKKPLDDVIEITEIQEISETGPSASCLIIQDDAVIGCSYFVNTDGEGTTAMQAAYALCSSGPGTWQEGTCPLSSATGECQQPGTTHFQQIDYCYGAADPCRQTCLGEFRELSASATSY